MQSILQTAGIVFLIVAVVLGGLTAYFYRAWRIRDILDDLSGKTRMAGIEDLRSGYQVRNARANRKGRAKALDIEAAKELRNDASSTSRLEADGAAKQPKAEISKAVSAKNSPNRDRNAGTIYFRDTVAKAPPQGVVFRLVRSEIAINSDVIID